jgi:hypothetical protein
MVIVNTTGVSSFPLLNNRWWRNIDELGLRFTFLVIVVINTTRVMTSNFGLFNELARYGSIKDFQDGFSLHMEAG